MMVINAMFKCKEGKREFLREKMREEGIDTASRSEEGNLRYDLYMSTENSNDMMIQEFWETEAAWLEHRTLPHYARLEELKKDCVADVEVVRVFTE